MCLLSNGSTRALLLTFIVTANIPAAARTQEISSSLRYSVAALFSAVRGEATHFDRRQTWYGFGVQGRALSVERPEVVVELLWLPENEDTGPFKGQCGDGISIPYDGQPPDRVLGRAAEASAALLWQLAPRMMPRLRLGAGVGLRIYRERWRFFCDAYPGAPAAKSHTALTYAVRLRLGFGSPRAPNTLSLQWMRSQRLRGDRRAPGLSFDGLRVALTIPVVVWH